jgi:ring-1,2-phenylacetyl-CoA epoxidase subunit PaaC
MNSCVENKIAYLLHLADTTLILSQRNSEWCGHGPILEQDIAITNISLDLLGQSRNFYQYAAQLINESKNSQSATSPSLLERGWGEVDEDKLAYLRKEREFKNLLLAELPNGDWGQTILRLYLFSQFQYLLFEQLQQNKDEQLAAICTKALKEIKYHLRWSSEWVIRLGDGTDESKKRMIVAINELWRYTGEMFITADYETEMALDLASIQNSWTEKIKAIFDEATLSIPENTFMQTGGKTGTHTEHLGFILTELQYMQRAYPNSQW